MFHWICPECGREIPPSVKECTACDPKAPLAKLAAVPAATQTVATPVEAAPAAVPAAPVALAVAPEPVPDPLLALAEHIRAAQDAHTAPRSVEAKQPVESAPPIESKPVESRVDATPQEAQPEPVSSGVAELASAIRLSRSAGGTAGGGSGSPVRIPARTDIDRWTVPGDAGHRVARSARANRCSSTPRASGRDGRNCAATGSTAAFH